MLYSRNQHDIVQQRYSNKNLKKIPWTGVIYYLFLMALEAGKSKIKAPTALVSGESSLPGLWMAVFLLCHPWQKEGVKEFSGVSFIRELSPFMTASAS